jgi:hypothetical protein
MYYLTNQKNATEWMEKFNDKWLRELIFHEKYMTRTFHGYTYLLN